MKVCRKTSCNSCKLDDTRHLDDAHNTEVCNKCDEIVSYERHEVEDKTKAVKKIKKKKSKGPEIDFENPPEEVEVKKKKKKKREIKPGKIYTEDCLVTMKDMKNKQVDYIVTSPPYNIGESLGYEQGKYDIFGDSMNQQEYFEWQVSLIDEMLRVAKNHIFYNTQILAGNKIAIFTLLEHYKYQIKDIAIWNKKIAPPNPTKGVFNCKFELVICFSNQKPENRNFLDGNFQGNLNNIIEVEHESNKYSKGHKAVFPTSLPKFFMHYFGKENDIWYDPFGGTGTTAIAALEMNRRWILSELSEEYVKKYIEPRVSGYGTQLKIG